MWGSLLLVMSLLVAPLAYAAEEAVEGDVAMLPLRVMRIANVNARPEQVWKTIGNFADLSWAPDAVSSSELISGDKNGVGAKRRVTLKSGGTLDETLVSYSEAEFGYTYDMESGALPVQGYSSTLRVVALHGGSQISWIGRFKRKDAADSAGDAAAEAAVKALYDAGLSTLEKQYGKLILPPKPYDRVPR